MGDPLRPNPNAPLAAFNVQAFVDLVNNRGLTFRWSRALACLCRLRADGDQFDPNCSKCASDGYYYVNPAYKRQRHRAGRNYLDVRAVLSNIEEEPGFFNPLGAWQTGTAVLTAQVDDYIGYRDRFIGIEQVQASSQYLIRGAGSEVVVGLHDLPNSQRRQAMRYEPIDVNYVEDDAGTVYHENVDWRVVSRGGVNRLTWLADKGPVVDAPYVVHYTSRPVWLVDEATFGIQHSRGPARGLSGPTVKQNLPTTFKVKLDYLTSVRPVGA